MYVYHPTKATLSGSFWYGLYADVGGAPGGPPLSNTRDTTLPYANTADSQIVNDDINATFQTIAAPAGTTLSAGARYWVCISASTELQIFADTTGAHPDPSLTR